METTQLTANLYLFRFEVGQAYLWRDDDGLTLIDTGVSGSGALIEHGITELGIHPRELKRVVLTHFHGDHAGSATEIRASSGAPTIAHRRDAPLIRGELPPPPPVLSDWERPLFERVGKENLTGPPAQVDQEVESVRCSISAVARCDRDPRSHRRQYRRALAGTRRAVHR